MTTFSVVHALLGVPQGAPLPSKHEEPHQESVPSPPREMEAPRSWVVLGAYHPNDHGTNPGGDHVVVQVRLVVGRLRREPGDALCKPRRKFWELSAGREESRQANCKRCLEIAARIGIDLGDPSAPLPQPGGSS